MNYSSYRISLNNHDTSSQITLNAKQGETGRKIYVSLTEGGIPYEIEGGCRAVFSAEKPDGNLIYNDCTIENNVIVYTITPQTTAAMGFVACEIKLYDANDILLISPRFGLLVEEPVFNDQNIPESGPEFNAIKDIVDKTVVAYLTENPVATDATLSKTGWAADAKETGDQIQDLKNKKLDKSGGDVSGAISMTDHKITNLAEPTSDKDAVTKHYADAIKKTADGSIQASGGKMTGALEVLAPTQSSHAANKEYVDTRKVTANLTAAGWSDAAPYTQAVNIDGLTDKKYARVYPAWPSALEEKQALSEETIKVRSCERSGNTMTFQCWEEKPIMDIPIVVEVYV